PVVGIGIRPAGLHRHGDLLANAGEELTELGVACEDPMLTFFKDAAHGDLRSDVEHRAKRAAGCENTKGRRKRGDPLTGNNGHFPRRVARGTVYQLKPTSVNPTFSARRSGAVPSSNM